MQAVGKRNKLTSEVHANIYQDTPRKGDKPKRWGWNKEAAKPGVVVIIKPRS